MEILTPQLVRSRMEGQLDITLAQAFIDGLTALIGYGETELRAFHDWEGVTDYDSDARLLLAPWSKEHRDKFAAVHLLLRSRVLAVGIRMVNSITNDVITPHTDRKKFETEFAKARARAKL